MDRDVRQTAWWILNTLEQQSSPPLDRIMETIGDEEFSRRDRGLLNALVYGVLRKRGQLDYLIAAFSKVPLKQIAPEILNILRLGLYQIVFLDKIPAFAAVNTSVELAKISSLPWTAKFVNGVLRNAVRRYKSIKFPDITVDPVRALAVAQSFPEWLIQRWLKRFGLDETITFCEAMNAIPPITVRVNTLKTSKDALIQALTPHVEHIEATVYAPEAIRLINPDTSIPKLAGFQAGWFQVQDEAAQLVTCLLNPQPGETVLDACAGLGGKTGHIAQRMQNQGYIIANDSDESKLLCLESEMKRLGISMVTTRWQDLNREWDQAMTFDRILLDAPCSGLGVLRRNPDIRWRMNPHRLTACQQRQCRFLNLLADKVKPSGVMVYAVCSTEPEENEAVIEKFFKQRSDFVIDSHPSGLPEHVKPLLDPQGYLRTFPNRHQTDGFFAVCLRKVNSQK